MSHRRKSARPSNKHWLSDQSHHEMGEDEGEEPISDRGAGQMHEVEPISDRGAGLINEVEPISDRGSGPMHEVEPISDRRAGQAIEIPSDIFKDFEQLKHATNLDTTTLMRNLLNDYHRLPPSSWHQVKEEPKATPLLEDTLVMRDPPPYEATHSPMLTGSPHLRGSPLLANSPHLGGDFTDTRSSHADADAPLDLSLVVKSEGSSPERTVHVAQESVHSDRLKPFQRILGLDGSQRNSPLCYTPPVVMVTSAMLTTDVMMSQRQGGLVMASSMPNQCKVVMSSAVPATGTITTGDKGECIMMPMQMSMQLPTVTTVEGQKFLTGNFNVDTNGGQNIVAIPILQAVTGTVPGVPVQTVLEAKPSITVPAHQQQQLQQQLPPQPQAPQHVPARRGRKPGSLNKGNKPAKPAKSNEMKVVAENTMFPGVYTSILKLPWSRRSRTKAQPAAPPPQPPPQPAMSLQLPAPTLPLDNQTPEGAVSTQPATTQSVMMVYPNATISALGKPVRKRGRPPKLPVLSHLLTEKKPKRENVPASTGTPVPSQCASISADGSMLSILNTHSIGSDATKDDDRPSLEVMHTSDNSTHQTSAYQTQSLTSHPNIAPKGSNGAMFQEMILSSKSLINIKPRKRQSSNVIKSGENFICTSFRIRPRGTRHKAVDKPLPQQEPQQAPAELAPAPDLAPPQDDVDTSTDAGHLSPTSTVVDSPLSRNMFHELYHCKVCNEIVPAEEKLSHKQKHVPVKFFCLTCGQEYYSYLQKNGDDPDAPQSFQCERCTEGYKDSLSLSTESRSIWCEFCEQEFKSESDLSEHKLEVHGSEKVDLDDFSCDECDKVFLTEEGLQDHKESHEKGLRCLLDDCPVMSADEAELDSHIKECHNKREYPCVYDDCKKKFMKRFHLQEHIRVKHFNIRAYRCSWPGCCKEFAAERHLKVHLLIHKDEKPLKCDFCDYRCRQRNAMNWHMRKHPEAPYRYRKFGMLAGGDD